MCVCTSAQKEEEEKPTWQTLPILTVAQAGVLVLFFQLFQLLCLIIFIIQSVMVQTCQHVSAPQDRKLSLQGHMPLAASPRGGPLLPAGAKLVCCLLPPLPAMEGVLLWVAGVVGLRVSLLLFPARALLHYPHSTLHPCKHHCTREALQFPDKIDVAPLEGSCPFSLSVLFILQQTGRNCVCVLLRG